MKTNDNSYKLFGERLDAVMVKQNISNSELAKQMFVSTSTISGYRTGRRSPNVIELATLTRLLHVSADFLIGTTICDIIGLNSSGESE